MAYVLCDIHGGNIAPLVCTHVDQRLSRGEAIGDLEHVDFDGILTMGWLCADCSSRDAVKRYSGGRAIDELKTDEEWAELMDPIGFVPVCPRCLETARTRMQA